MQNTIIILLLLLSAIAGGTGTWFFKKTACDSPFIKMLGEKYGDRPEAITGPLHLRRYGPDDLDEIEKMWLTDEDRAEMRRRWKEAEKKQREYEKSPEYKNPFEGIDKIFGK